MRRHCHDRSSAILRQDIVADPHGNKLAVRRIDSLYAAKLYPGLFLSFGSAEHLVFLFGIRDIIVDGGLILCARKKFCHKRVFRREHDIRHAKERIRARRKYGNGLAAAMDLEIKLASLALADPIALDLLYMLGPFQAVES